MRKYLAALAILLSAAPVAANAATFVLHAATHDAGSGEPITYDGTLTTDDGTATSDGLVYRILTGAGTASFDGLTASIADAYGDFTLDGNGDVSVASAYFMLNDYFGFGSIQKGAYNYIAVSEVAGPVELLSITPQVNGAVPEPATWAMMIMGFGLMGAALRGRKTKVVFA